VVLLVAAACGTDGGDDDTTTTAASGQDDPTSTTQAAEEPMDGVHATDTDLGSILVDPEGFTLYVFTADTDGESTCYDACAELWPSVAADTAIGSDLDGSIFGATTRTDGSEQLTVNGMPVYLYTPDASPGDTTGQGVGDVWFVIDASGNMIEAAAADAVPVDYGY
jgi:predicted lipoprotein with Yx(FWY)xxD motif